MKKYSIMLLLFTPLFCIAWGFMAHKEINRQAVYTLPPEMQGFYKKHIDFISDHAVAPDRRKYVIEEEGQRHYIDLDKYPVIIHTWKEAVAHYTQDTLYKYGTVPWYIQKVKYMLTKAFVEKNTERILRLSADMGHYIADANVPLHTTSNYDGQLTNQKGLHSFWETRLPELYMKDYKLNVGKATYIADTQMEAWKAVFAANKALDSVLVFEQQLNKKYTLEKKYAMEERNGKKVKVYSKEYSQAYHKMLKGMIERQMRRAIKMTGNFWYTCWVDAGQPDLSKLPEPIFEKEEWESRTLPKKHEGGE